MKIQVSIQLRAGGLMLSLDESKSIGDNPRFVSEELSNLIDEVHRTVIVMVQAQFPNLEEKLKEEEVRKETRLKRGLLRLQEAYNNGDLAPVLSEEEGGLDRVESSGPKPKPGPFGPDRTFNSWASAVGNAEIAEEAGVILRTSGNDEYGPWLSKHSVAYGDDEAILKAKEHEDPTHFNERIRPGLLMKTLKDADPSVEWQRNALQEGTRNPAPSIAKEAARLLRKLNAGEALLHIGCSECSHRPHVGKVCEIELPFGPGWKRCGCPGPSADAPTDENPSDEG